MIFPKQYARKFGDYIDGLASKMEGHTREKCITFKSYIYL